MARQTEKAFKWVIGLLREHGIPFVVTGGLAAKGYGVKRPLADIDIAIQEDRFGEIYYDFVPYAFYGPGNYKDESWDIFLVTLEYEGQEVDLCSTKYKIFDKHSKSWFFKERDLQVFNTIEFYGIPVPVVPKASLFEEKLQLSRRADKEDVSELCANDPEITLFLNKIKALGLPKGKYAVFGSGPLAVRGVRRTGDIDIVVLPNLYDQCLHGGFEERRSNGTLKLVKNGFDIYQDWNFSGYRPDVKALISGAESIDGVPFVSLSEVLKWKKVFGREKDEADIKMIDEYMKMANPGTRLG